MNVVEALILDEFQTWYDGLANTKQFPWRSWAFNFIQILSEIAKEYPDQLVLVVSVRNGQTDAFQIHEDGNRFIFGGGAGYRACSASPTSALNLLGKVEGRGINTGTRMHDLTLRVEQLTGAQLQDLLKKLPDGMTYALELEREDD